MLFQVLHPNTLLRCPARWIILFSCISLCVAPSQQFQLELNEHNSNARLAWTETSMGVHIATFQQNSEKTCNENSVNSSNVLDFILTVKDDILTHYRASGAVLLRGFPIPNAHDAERAFQMLTHHRPGGGPLGWLPAWMQNASKECIMWAMFWLTDPNRKGGMRVLGPASRNVQGPHQEASFLTWRMPHVGFYCETAPTKYGETALYDAVAAYQALSPDLQQKLNQYEYQYLMYGGILWDILPRFLHDFISKTAFLLFNQPTGCVPLLLKSPVSGETCLQWFGFGKRINEMAAGAFNKFYPGREVVACQDYFGEYFIRSAKDLEEYDPLPIAADGKHFLEEDEVAITEAFFARSYLVAWQKHDLALLDNIRWAHGRANGEPPRKLHFFQAQPIISIKRLR